MAKKTANKTAKPIVDVDSLVNEGRSVDLNKVNEIITEAEAKKKEETKVSEENKEEVEFVQVITNNEETVEENDVTVEDTFASTIKEEENIDDVIAECTGEADDVEEKTDNVETNEEECEKVASATHKEDVPWYVARAMRGNDYFSW